MSPIITALKALYVALGGSLTDHYSDIADNAPVSAMVLTPDLVRALSKLEIGGGGGLPEVTDADNGDVLTVVNGAWAKAAASGGAIYAHNLAIAYETDDATENGRFGATILSSSSTSLTSTSDVIAALGAKVVAADGTGTNMDAGNDFAIVGMAVVHSGSTNYLDIQTISAETAYSGHSYVDGTVTITDTVTEI